MRPGLSSTLSQILSDTEAETSAEKVRHSLKRLKQMVKDAPRVNSFHDALAPGNAMIAEIKEQSPSQGRMRAENVRDAALAYKECRAVKAVSVLTNSTHFGAGMNLKRLSYVREFTGKPTLRKDFIVEEYQVYQARAHGADAILLMANILEKESLRRLSDLAFELGMDVLFETHSPSELADLPETARIVGINCRNFDAGKSSLRSFWVSKILRQTLKVKRDQSVDLSRFDYASELPAHVIKIAESGVTPANCANVLAKGFHAVLVGTSLLMDERGLPVALQEFQEALGQANPAPESSRPSNEPSKPVVPPLKPIQA